MIRPLGAFETLITPPSTDDFLQGAGVTDLVARRGGGAYLLYGFGVTTDSAEAGTSRTQTVYFASVDAAGALTTRLTLDVLVDLNQATRLAVDARGSALLFRRVLASTDQTLEEFDAAGRLRDGPDALPLSLLSAEALNDPVGLADGGSILFYEDEGDILGQRFTAANAAADGPFRLTTTGEATERGAAAARLASGEIAVAFTRSEPADPGDVQLAIREADGGALRAPVTIHRATDGAQSGADVAALSSGGFVVTFTDREGVDGGDIRARVYDANLRALGADFVVNTTLATEQEGAAVEALSGGRFVVIWNDADGAGLRAQLYDRLGSRIGAETVISAGAPPAVFDFDADAAEVAPGRLLIAFSRDQDQEGVLARRYDIGAAGTAGSDTLSAATLGRVLEGLAGNDALRGGALADVLVGGRGRDVMTGGVGADDFVFDSVAETGRTASTRDVIRDLRPGDDIVLTAIDANGSAAGAGAFRFLAAEGAAFTGQRGQLRFDQQDLAGRARDRTIVEGDVNGDRAADFQIELTGLIDLRQTDFAL